MSQTYMCTFPLKTTALCNGFGFTDVSSVSLRVKTAKQLLINLCQTLHSGTSTRTYKKNESSFSSDQYISIIHYTCTEIPQEDTITLTYEALQTEMPILIIIAITGMNRNIPSDAFARGST